MKRRALIVDDSGIMRQMLRQILEKNGLEVVGGAEDGLQAIRLYRELKPDLVTLDMIMPQQNGLDTLKEIKRLDPNATVVMVSSIASKNSIEECAEAGARHYILKPFSEEKVMSVLRVALELMASPAAPRKPA